eukprot:scaffold131153_cov66-Phaeocystis_antarctica.AAC.2
MSMSMRMRMQCTSAVCPACTTACALHAPRVCTTAGHLRDAADGGAAAQEPDRHRGHRPRAPAQRAGAWQRAGDRAAGIRGDARLRQHQRGARAGHRRGPRLHLVGLAARARGERRGQGVPRRRQPAGGLACRVALRRQRGGALLARCP